MKTILLVDDSELCRLLFRLSLPNEVEYTVHEASDGEAALRALASLTPDLVVMDYRMPGHTGQQLAQSLRASGISVPMALLTASMARDLDHAALAAYFHVVCEKPIDEHKMAAILQPISD